MDEDFGASIIEITDDEGETFSLELLGSVEYEGEEYRVFLPAEMDENDPDYGFIILKVVEVDNEEQFENVDEDTLQAVYDEYMRRLFDDDEA